MSKLRFDYKITHIPNVTTNEYLDEKLRADFENEKNEKFKDYIDRINACGGFYNVRSFDTGTKKYHGNLAATRELLEEINRLLPEGAI